MQKSQISQPAIRVVPWSNPNSRFCPPSRHPFTLPLPRPSRTLSSSVTDPAISSFYMSHWPWRSLHLWRYIYFLPLFDPFITLANCLCLIPPSQMGIFLSSALISLLLLHAPCSKELIASTYSALSRSSNPHSQPWSCFSFLVLIFRHANGHLHLSGLPSPQTKPRYPHEWQPPFSPLCFYHRVT